MARISFSVNCVFSAEFVLHGAVRYANVPRKPLLRILVSFQFNQKIRKNCFRLRSKSRLWYGSGGRMRFRNNPTGFFELLQIIFADSILFSKLDGSQFVLSDPVPHSGDLHAVPRCNFGAGVKSCHFVPPFCVFYKFCVF